MFTKRSNAVPVAGIPMLEQLLSYTTVDPRILSLLFSCISSLFPFISQKPAILTTVFNKIMEPLVTYSQSSDVSSLSNKENNELRRHSCCLLIKLAKNHSEIMLPGFKMMTDMVGCLLTSTNVPSVGIRVLLYEALVIISNEKKDIVAQNEFIAQILLPVKTFLEENKSVWNDPSAFINFIGLSSVSNGTQPPEIGKRRKGTIFSFSLVECIVRHFKSPAQPISDGRGRNSCFLIIEEVLHPLFSIIRTLNSLTKPECSALLHPSYSKVHSMPSHESDAILSIKRTDKNSSADSDVEQMQNFFHYLYEKWCNVMGHLPVCDSQAFYSLPNLTQYALQSPLYALTHLSDYRLRLLVRNFCKSWFLNCPDGYRDSFLKPLLGHILSFFNDHLDRRWQKVGSIEISDDIEGISEEYTEDSNVLDEVLEAMTARLLTRDYLDMLKSLLTTPTPISPFEIMEMRPTGQYILSQGDMLAPLMSVLLKCISWPSSSLSIKASHILWTCLKCIITSDSVANLLTSDDCVGIMRSYLSGLNIHGHHLENHQFLLISLVNVYTLLRPGAENLDTILLSLPNVQPTDVQKLAQLTAASIESNVKNAKLEKHKREYMKKIVSGIIGVSVSESMKATVQMGELPPLCKKKKINSPPVEEREGDIGLCNLFD